MANPRARAAPRGRPLTVLETRGPFTTYPALMHPALMHTGIPLKGG